MRVPLVHWHLLHRQWPTSKDTFSSLQFQCYFAIRFFRAKGCFAFVRLRQAKSKVNWKKTKDHDKIGHLHDITASIWTSASNAEADGRNLHRATPRRNSWRWYLQLPRLAIITKGMMWKNGGERYLTGFFHLCTTDRWWSWAVHPPWWLRLIYGAWAYTHKWIRIFCGQHHTMSKQSNFLTVDPCWFIHF